MSDYEGYDESEGEAKKGFFSSPIVIGGIIAAVLLVGGGITAAVVVTSGGSETGTDVKSGEGTVFEGPETYCHALKKQNPDSKSGNYQVEVDGENLEVFCDMVTEGGGWTVLFNRFDGSVGFDRNWAEYQRGFGNVAEDGNFFLGLDHMNKMTSGSNCILRVHVEDFDGKTGHAEYKTFEISDSTDNYKLTIGNYSGTAGDSFSPLNGNPFSTIDRDNDINNDKSCAEVRGKGGNWYYGKQTTKEFQCLSGGNNLNGIYGQLDPDVKRTEDELKTRQIASMNWYYLKGKYVPLKSAAYMVRDC